VVAYGAGFGVLDDDLITVEHVDRVE